MIEVRWHGRGGQGAFTASKILGAAAIPHGKYALAFPSFGPERRGAPIQAFTKISDSKITDRSVIKKCDYIIYLDDTLYNSDIKGDLKTNGKILINSRHDYEDEDIISIDADKISQEILGRPVSNTAMLAALASISGIVEIDNIKEALALYLPKKILDKNKEIIDTVIARRE